MNQLQEFNRSTISSVEIAGMMKISHWEVLRKLDGTEKVKGIIQTFTDNKIVVSDYFIESSYKDASGKVNKCYELTKMGCEFLANKFTGEKGILFTAMYVKRFNEMERNANQPSYAIE
ncbi:Rha family transcriptional regulator, partial [Paenibacillus alvei]